MIMIDSDTIFVHGGHDCENEKLNDIWMFDLKTNTWSEII